MTQRSFTSNDQVAPKLSGLPPREPGLSLVLATLGRTIEIARYFDSISGSSSSPIEVILVDQNEDERLADIVRMGIASGLDVRHLRIAPRKGLSLARNEGLRMARYAMVGFPDDDCWYEEGVCENVIRSFAIDPRLDGIVARWLDRHAVNKQQQILNPTQQRRFCGVPIASICLFLRTERVINLGCFDERLGVGTWSGSSEETDLVLRLMMENARLEFRPDMLVRHHWPGTSIPVTGNFVPILRGSISRARGTGAMYAKHDLDSVVVLRGLMAPFGRMLGMKGGLRGFAYWLGTGIGRWQGYSYWKKLRTSCALPRTEGVSSQT
jgi:hypothetical protein